MKDNLNIILLGAPGAGKGTLAEVVISKFKVSHISTGNIFRQEISNKTELGLKISELIKNGKLVPDDLTVEVLVNKIKDMSGGMLFDGFPRTLAQAESLDKFLSQQGKAISAVIYINLPEEEILNRLSLRRTCKNCKSVYNLVSMPPKQENVCDKCGGELILRSDDKPETVKERLSVFHKQTEPLINYYRAGNKFFEINGVGLPEEVSGRVLKVLDSI